MSCSPAPFPPQARIADITISMGLFFGGLWMDKVLGVGDTPSVVRTRAAQLRETLTYLGPSFIKAGQVLANRPDIVREDYMNELCVLQVRGKQACRGCQSPLAADARCGGGARRK